MDEKDLRVVREIVESVLAERDKKREKFLRCVFCGKTQSSKTQLISSQICEAAICADCVNVCVGVIKEHTKTPKEE